LKGGEIGVDRHKKPCAVLQIPIATDKRMRELIHPLIKNVLKSKPVKRISYGKLF
jgi:hypothetical protein